MPFPFIAAGLAVGVAGDLAGGIFGSSAAKEAARARARVAMLRAADTDVSAYETREAGRVAAGVRQSAVTNIRGAQKAALAANGVRVGTGTALALETQTQVLGDLDALALRVHAEQHARHLDREAESLRESAGAEIAAGDTLSTAAWMRAGFGAAGGLLNLASDPDVRGFLSRDSKSAPTPTNAGQSYFHASRYA